MTNLDSTSGSALQREILSFYWGVWSELGVSGWGRTHNNWAIDPEPLIVFSPCALQREPRLRDEVIDWCSANWRHISTVRLRHLLSNNKAEDTPAWGEFAATVNQSTGLGKWPLSTEPREFARTGRSSLRPLPEPSMVYLRMRSIFGLSARTEVLRYLLFTRERSTAAMLASQTNYAKRNVADACESLVQSGVLKSKLVGNRLYFMLANDNELAAFLGPAASVTPDWPALLRVCNKLIRWTESIAGADDRVITVATHNAFNEIQSDLETLRISNPDHPAGSRFTSTWMSWASSLAKTIAVGQWPATP